MDIMIVTKGGDKYRGMDSSFVTLDYRAIGLGVQMELANSLVNDGNGIIPLGMVTIDKKKVEYKHPVVQALAAAVIEKTSLKLGVKKPKNNYPTGP